MGCNLESEKDQLIRVVRGAGGVRVDETGRAAGRGAYLCPDESCLETVLKRNRLERALATKISRDDLAEITLAFKSLSDKQKAS